MTPDDWSRILGGLGMALAFIVPAIVILRNCP